MNISLYLKKFSLLETFTSRVKIKKTNHIFILTYLHVFIVISFLCTPAVNAAATPQAGQVIPMLSNVTGDALATGSIGEPSNLIAMFASDTASSEITNRIYVGLLKYDANLNIVPEAAESFEVLDEGLRIRFKIRPRIYWSDGNELDADDVEFTYRLMIDPNTPTAYAGDYLRVKNFKKLDKFSFEVSYEKPFARSLITWMHAILPKRALLGSDLRKTPLARAPVTNGPFKLKEWNAGVRLLLSANADYFDGRPNTDGIIYRIIPDLSTMFWELKAGKIDMMQLTPQQYVYQTNDESFKKSFNVYKDLGYAYTFMGYNLKSPLFSDVRVRQAFAYAINKSDIISGALFEQGVEAFGPYRPGSWAYNDKLKPYTYDPVKAAKLLEECGWQRGKDGILVKDGRRFSFTVLINQGNEQRTKCAIIIQSQLKKLGVEVKIRTVEWAAFLNDFLNKGFFDAIILGWTITQDPDIFDVWHSSRAFAGGLNFVDYKNEEVDRLLEDGRSTFDLDKRKKCYDRIQEILHIEQPYCFLYVPYSLTALHKRFQGVKETPAGIGYNMIRWWVPQTKQLYRNMLQP